MNNSELKIELSAWEKSKKFLRNKWVGFTLGRTALYAVVRGLDGQPLAAAGLPVIFDLYITKFFYRYVWSHNAKMCQRSKSYNTVYEWVNAIIFATVVATLVHIFIFQMYVIPTSSMERSLLVGDYLYVSKVAYGPQMPNTPLSFPFVHHTMPFSKTKKSFSEAIKWPYHRLKGLKPIRRNDVVVFNFPAGDTVLLEHQDVTYYDVAAQFEQSFGKEEGRKRLNKNTRSSAARWTSVRTTSNAASAFRGTRSKSARKRRFTSTANRRSRFPEYSTCIWCKPPRPSRSTPSTISGSGSTAATARATT